MKYTIKMDHKKILCPECAKPMVSVAASSHYGRSILIDQCPACGGLWFDYFEMHELKPSEAERIDTVNIEKLSTITTRAIETLSCPRDHEALKFMDDLNFPVSLDVEYCKHCHGMWFNRGEYVAFHEEKKNKVALSIEQKKKDDELTRQIDRLLERHSTTGFHDSLAMIGKVLSTPVDHFGNVYGVSDQRQKEYAERTVDAVGRAAMVVNVLVGILRSLSGKR